MNSFRAASRILSRTFSRSRSRRSLDPTAASSSEHRSVQEQRSLNGVKLHSGVLGVNAFFELNLSNPSRAKPNRRAPRKYRFGREKRVVAAAASWLAA